MWERPETIAYFNLIRSWYLKGFIRKDSASTEDYTPDLASGKLFSGIVVSHPGALGENEQAFGFPFYLVNNTVPTISNDETQGAMNFISITSKDKDRAAMFMELENTDPFVNNTVAFGVEGTHWVKTSTGQIDFPKGLTAQTSGYVPAINWAFGNQFLNYLWTDEPANKWDLYKAYNKSAVPANTLAFIPDYEPIKNEIAALNNVWAEFEPGLETGSSGPGRVSAAGGCQGQGCRRRQGHCRDAEAVRRLARQERQVVSGGAEGPAPRRYFTSGGDRTAFRVGPLSLCGEPFHGIRTGAAKG